MFQYPGLTEEMKLLYRFDPTADPPQFDLSGFLSEAMQGRTLYGIIEFESEDKFRWEANPGAAGSNGAGIRPNRFDGLRTKIYRRVN